MQFGNFVRCGGEGVALFSRWKELKKNEIKIWIIVFLFATFARVIHKGYELLLHLVFALFVRSDDVSLGQRISFQSNSMI